MPSFQGFDWSNEETWPRDTQGYVFFARAINRIGEARHGEIWDGFARGPVPEPLSDDDEKPFEHIRRAHEALTLSGAHPQLEALVFGDRRAVQTAKVQRQARAVYVVRRQPKITVPGQQPPAPDETLEKCDAELRQHANAVAYTLEHWEAASELIEARRKPALERNKRLLSVRTEIEDAGLTGALRFKVMHETDLVPLSSNSTLTAEGWNALHGDCYRSQGAGLWAHGSATRRSCPRAHQEHKGTGNRHGAVRRSHQPTGRYAS